MHCCFGGVKPAGVLFFPRLSDERKEAKMVPRHIEPENQMEHR
jgi:hypothetical protein